MSVDPPDDLLNDALASARSAERRADVCSADALARIVDADARSVDADAQTRHAQTGIEAAKRHMEAARLHMEAANSHEADAMATQQRADERLAEAAALLADAEEDSAEYDRAVYHYTQLVRHRMANPIQVICGMAQTLRDQRTMDPELRHQMVVAIHEQAQVLERVCLDPRVLDDAERELRPRPFS